MYTVKGGFYGDALVMLEEQDLVLHYLSPLTAGGLQLRKKDLTEAIYGYDRASVYTAKSLNSRAEVKPCKKCLMATNSRYSMSLFLVFIKLLAHKFVQFSFSLLIKFVKICVENNLFMNSSNDFCFFSSNNYCCEYIANSSKRHVCVC